MSDAKLYAIEGGDERPDADAIRKCRRSMTRVVDRYLELMDTPELAHPQWLEAQKTGAWGLLQFWNATKKVQLKGSGGKMSLTLAQQERLLSEALEAVRAKRRAG